MNKSTMKSIKRIAKIVGTAVGALIVVLIATMAFFKFAPGYGFYIVQSGSMEPTINTGDIVFTHRTSTIQPGTVITFETNNEIVTHRAVSITAGQITTKGDANRTADPGTITVSDVRGSYLFRLPAIGYITNLTNSKSGWFLIVIVPTILIVLFLVKDILKEAFKDDKKKPATAKIAKTSAVEPKTASEVLAKAVIMEKPVSDIKVTKKAAPKSKPGLAPSAPEMKEAGRIVLTASTESLDLTAISPSIQEEKPVQAEATLNAKPDRPKANSARESKSVSSVNRTSASALSPALIELFNAKIRPAASQAPADNTITLTPMESVYSPTAKVSVTKLNTTIKKIFYFQK